MSITAQERSRQAAEVGRAVTRLHRDHHGRGATTTRTVFQGNYIVAFMEDIYTAAERTLIDANHQEAVKVTRQVFQMATEGRFIEAVESITGRKVAQCMAQVSFDPDMAVQIFVLEPVAGDRDEPGAIGESS